MDALTGMYPTGKLEIRTASESTGICRMVGLPFLVFREAIVNQEVVNGASFKSIIVVQNKKNGGGETFKATAFESSKRSAAV